MVFIASVSEEILDEDVSDGSTTRKAARDKLLRLTPPPREG